METKKTLILKIRKRQLAFHGRIKKESLENVILTRRIEADKISLFNELV